MESQKEQIEEFLELCWTAKEDGMQTVDRDHLPSRLLCFLPSPIEPDGGFHQETVDAMIAQGLLRARERHVELTPEGARRAQVIVRAHRLTEVLLHNVFDISERVMESTACQVEHILNTEVTDAVCAFLGHPPSCPHGRSIPRGICCEASDNAVAPLIIPMHELGVGEEGRVAFLHSKRHAYLQRLSSFGIAPGRRIRLRQTQPVPVIQIGETELALDKHASREIFVRRHDAQAAGQK